MYIESYKNLTVWQKSMQLSREIYGVTTGLPRQELYGLVAQMRRCAISIPSNIAEGYKRNGLREYLQFLSIADASAAELETQLILVKDLYPKLNLSRCENLLLEIQKMLAVMIRKLKNKKPLNAKHLTLNAKDGQILVEAMVAITIAVVGLLGVFALLSQSLSLNKVVIDQSVGANLAVEGIELVKNLIDGNIIQKRPWNEGVSAGQYELDFTDQNLSANQNRFLNFDASTGEYNYRAGQPSRFKRVVTIEEPGLDEIKVNSSVSWITRGGGGFSVNLEDHFFRWR